MREVWRRDIVNGQYRSEDGMQYRSEDGKRYAQRGSKAG